ncbi:MAG: diaminopimelate decarboxylase [Candidatus Saganbacteria bacterium]|nr:diaminopimelate decarboxylase [Candidatus Saganbacteria bacterium]
MRENLPITAKINNNGHLEIGGLDVVSLAEEFGTPLYILDEAAIRERCREYKTAFKSKYPNTEIIYASKALCNTGVLKIIKDEGLGVDVVSGGELYTALMAGCDPKKIYFHGNAKSQNEIEDALKAGVNRIVVDNFDELKVIDEVSHKAGILADILFRVNPGIEAHTHEFIQTGNIDSKFGISKERVLEGVLLAQKLNHVNFKGLHAHIGSQVLDAAPYKKLVEIMLTLCGEIFNSTKFEVEELNIGGGLGITYVDEAPPDINTLAEAVCSTLKNKCKELGIPEPKLILEPGRSIVGRAGVTAYRVRGIKDIPGVRKYVMLDGGMGDNIRPMLYGAKYDAILGNRANGKDEEVLTLAGRFCESGDVLIKDISLPKVEINDVLVVLCTGAYNYSMASNYNRVGRPAMVLVSGGDANIIVKRESYEDLTLRDVIVE